MREFRTILKDAGARVWLSAVAGLIAGLAEAAVLVLAVAAAIALSDASVPPATLPFGLSHASAGTLVAAGLLCAVVRIAAALGGLRLATTAKSLAEARYQRELLRAYLEASWETVAGRPEGELQELVSGQALVAAGSVQHAAQSLQFGLTFVVLVASSVAVSPVSAGASLAGACLLGLVLRPVARVASERSGQRMRRDLDNAALTAETVRLAEEVSVFGVGSEQAARGNRLIDEKRGTGAAAEFAAGLTPVAYQGAVFIIVLLGLGLLAATGASVGAAVAATIVLLLRAFAYSQQAQHGWVSALAALPRRQAVLEATRALAGAKPLPGGRRLPEIATCRLVGVSYSYPSGERALTDVDLALRCGDALGVTGPSGSGKSTLVQLLLRLRVPTRGQYLVNDGPAQEYDMRDWSAQVSVVPQDPKLIEGTIADNIRFLRRRITPEQIVRAALLAGLGDGLGDFPEALDRPVGPRDRALSGGQRQRLAIARALAGEPSLLVLDEPTSALDAECERVIQETLESMKGTVTVVVVTHRHTTLLRCDRVVLLGDGSVEAEGAPDEVLRRAAGFGGSLGVARLTPGSG